MVAVEQAAHQDGHRSGRQHPNPGRRGAVVPKGCSRLAEEAARAVQGKGSSPAQAEAPDAWVPGPAHRSPRRLAAGP